LAETERARAEEQTRAANRLRTRNRVIAVAGIIALIAAVVALIFGQQSNNNAQQAQLNLQTAQTQEAHAVDEAQARATQQAVAEANFTRAEAQRLASDANVLLLSDGYADLIALLSLRSMKMVYTPQGDAVLEAVARLNAVWAFRPRPELHPFTSNDMNPVSSVAFSPDSQILTTGDVDGLHFWEITTGQPLHTISETGHVTNIKFSPDGRYLLSGNSTEVASLWDIKTWQLARQFVAPDSGWLEHVAFSRDGRSILGSTCEDNLFAFDIQTGEVKQRIHVNSVDRLAVSPEGEYVLTADSPLSTVRLWEVRTGHLVRSFVHSNVYGMAFAPDGKTIATAGRDKVVRLWNIATGQEILSIVGHADAVRDVDFSPDGKTVATASADGTARLWDASTGQEVRRFVGHTSDVLQVVFSPDGQYVATSSNDGTARLWDVDYHTTMEYLCANLRRDLSDDERRQYGIADSTPTCPK
jgi:DNA-binding beta-propeller fold protein YncE